MLVKVLRPGSADDVVVYFVCDLRLAVMVLGPLGAPAHYIVEKNVHWGLPVVDQFFTKRPGGKLGTFFRTRSPQRR